MKKSTVIIVAAVVIVLGYVGIAYGGMVSSSDAVDARWVQAEVQYQNRFDLIPDLVNAVKVAMGQEQSVFEAIEEARARYVVTESIEEKVRAISDVESSFARLLVVIENYPELKNRDAVRALISKVEGTEQGISSERSAYNNAVRSYNLTISGFPKSLLASAFGYEARTYFQSVGSVIE